MELLLGGWANDQRTEFGSLSCRLGASGRLVLDGKRSRARDLFPGLSGLYRGESLVVSILVCV